MGADADQAMTCRQRAEHIWVIVEGMTNQESREFMLRLSEDYERLADAIETVGALLETRGLISQIAPIRDSPQSMPISHKPPKLGRALP